jgi:virulence-associated protein VagC
MERKGRIALEIDSALLTELGIDESSEFEVRSDGQSLIITPLSAHTRQVRDSADRIMRRYHDLFKRLAE